MLVDTTRSGYYSCEVSSYVLMQELCNSLKCLSTIISASGMMLTQFSHTKVLYASRPFYASGITTLDISHNLLQDISALRFLNTLSKLILHHNKLTAAGCWRYVAEFRNLEYFDVSFNKIESIPTSGFLELFDYLAPLELLLGNNPISFDQKKIMSQLRQNLQPVDTGDDTIQSEKTSHLNISSDGIQQILSCWNTVSLCPICVVHDST
eukprot:Filipodium_phascolosomae@DN675_c0_g1_i1.p1